MVNEKGRVYVSVYFFLLFFQMYLMKNLKENRHVDYFSVAKTETLTTSDIQINVCFVFI